MPADRPLVEPRSAIAFALLWFAAGSAWTVQLFLPWTTVGLFSSSSMLDGARLLGSGNLSGAPGGAQVFLLAIPITGLVVAGSAGLSGNWIEWARLFLTVGVALMFTGLVQNVAGADIGRLGPGGWVTMAGLLLAMISLAGRLLWLRDQRGQEH